MNSIPPKTLERLAMSYGQGERHDAMLKIAMPLIGQGFSPDEVFEILRQKFPDEDKTDKEIHDVVSFCQSKNPKPCQSKSGKAYFAPQTKKQISPKQYVKEFIGESIQEKETETLDPRRIFELYDQDDFLNIVTNYELENEKAKPRGGGIIKTVRDWLQSDFPVSKAGAWIRFNPCSETGNGTSGAVLDGDIKKFKFVLVESDTLEGHLQLALYERWKLPIAAIVSSGGSSYHAWIPIAGVEDKDEYKALAERLLEILKPFGIDQANKNASRMCRLPGVFREIRKDGDGNQKLCFINPKATPITFEDLEDFSDSLKPLPLQPVTARDLVIRSIPRWELLHANQGKNGILTGYSCIDKMGGFQAGDFAIVGAETNVGKTCFALNILNRAIMDGFSVALFTMEMNGDEIIDVLASMRVHVERTKFRTGEFTMDDLMKMNSFTRGIVSQKLFVFEEPDPSIDQMRFTCKRMVRDHGVQMIIADYLQLARAMGKDHREQEVTAVGRGLRSIAKENRIPVLALSQLNDDGKLRESRSLSHEASMIFLLKDTDEKHLDGTQRRKLGAIKGRSIEKEEITLKFYGKYATMVEIPKI